jgi:ribosome-binding factor A
VNAQTRLKRTPKLAFMVDPAIASAEAIDELLRRQRHDDE